MKGLILIRLIFPYPSTKVFLLYSIHCKHSNVYTQRINFFCGMFRFEAGLTWRPDRANANGTHHKKDTKSYIKKDTCSFIYF